MHVIIGIPIGSTFQSHATSNDRLQFKTVIVSAIRLRPTMASASLLPTTAPASAYPSDGGQSMLPRRGGLGVRSCPLVFRRLTRFKLMVSLRVLAYQVLMLLGL